LSFSSPAASAKVPLTSVPAVICVEARNELLPGISSMSDLEVVRTVFLHGRACHGG